MRILFIGDVVGRIGRNALQKWLPNLRKELSVDFVIANGENSAGGIGITEGTAKELLDSGVDCLTTGNHVWKQKEAIQFLSREHRVLRPANFPPEAPGSGWCVLPIRNKDLHVAVINIMGQIFMEPILDCPFKTLDKVLEQIHPKTPLIIVDFHAEATSEKQAFAYYADGRVTAVIGTHTHVMTADERLMPKGTAFITDVGMTGAIDSIIGMRVNEVLYHFVTKMPIKFEVATGKAKLCAVLIEAEVQNGKALSIQRVEKEGEIS
ncbi:MAG: TIGR00282 family metallophosphoesterase [Armatimonadetes bacterium]|nr:TIGR00282 family metallophosphoesterase [Armatimonadota bacterium]